MFRVKKFDPNCDQMSSRNRVNCHTRDNGFLFILSKNQATPGYVRLIQQGVERRTQNNCEYGDHQLITWTLNNYMTMNPGQPDS